MTDSNDDSSRDGESASIARLVPCPRCRTMTAFAPSNPFRPFCSERCRTIDLGAWAEERYTIPTAPAPGSAEADAQSDDEDGSWKH